jgi:hypothetical protein
VHATALDEGGADGTTGYQNGEEHDLRSFKKMLLGAVTIMAIVAGVVASPASATDPVAPVAPTGVIPTQLRDTMNSNVPYLAWQGEHVRLVWCNKAFTNAATTTWMLVDPLNWPDFAPAVDPLSVQTVAGTGCVKGTWISDKPGLAAIKAIVHVGDASYTKDFLVGWMQFKSVVAKGGGDVFAADFCDKPNMEDSLTAESIKLLGPYSNCWHNYPPIDPRHRINIIVKGTLPLEADFSNYGLGKELTLPDDWAKWAAVAATSQTDHTFAQAMSNWDIHDDSLTTEGHTITSPLGTQCPPGTDPKTGEIYVNFDSVDNCTTGNTHGGFSTVFGSQSTAGKTIGPFDPVYSFDTMLSDGKVDPGDAPMPAAQVDVTIKDNDPLNKTDIGGVGYLFPSWKSEVYSRDGKGGDIWTGDDSNPVLPHNYYAPFYSQFIPATSRTASPTGSPYGANPPPSGIEGTGTNGFGGFLVSGEYRNWAFAWPMRRGVYGDTHCLFSQVLPGLAERFRPLPSGINSVSVYTDESGEANINFVPGLGMYFDNLTAANLNKNGGCDLENVDPIGTAEVDVVAKYPFQQPTARPLAADPVNFKVHNLFKKTLTVFSKGVDKNNIVSNSVARIVLTHAQDIDGSPLAYELVCWMADGNAAGFRVFAGTLPVPAPTKDDPDALLTLDPWHALLTTYQDPWGLGRLCTFTDRWGNSAIEVYNSGKTPVDVIAEYVNEGILRDTIVHFETPPTLGQDGTTSPDGPPSSHVPTPTQLSQAVAVSATGPVLAPKSTTVAKTIKSKQTKKLVLHKIRYAQVVTPFHQKAKLLVRVNGKAGMVKLRITILKGGKAHTYIRFIPANRKMTVKNLSIPAKTAKVTVKLIGL